jgi:ribose/xylose/arabinose/galactoside ABC-type transport system permease subunit
MTTIDEFDTHDSARAEAVETTRGASAAAAAPAADERLAYRSVFQRLAMRPEIGAIVGAVGIWTFFWAVSGTFGTVGQTFGWLDTAATLGIMAVAVSMLMIGGEFDLSSGAMTGAMGMLIIYLVKETGELGGRGFPLVLALPLSLAFALGIGFLNGWMVEKTGQPSFIITLSTYFALIGLKLGLAKRFVDQIQIGRTDEAPDFAFFRPIFAAEWERNGHVFEQRDFFYIAFITLGVLLAVLAICELWFQRRDDRRTVGLIQFLVALAVGIAAGIGLHVTDGSAANAAIAVVLTGCVLVGLYGWASWRYEPVSDRGSVVMDSTMKRRIGGGLLLVVLAGAVAVLVDSASTNNIFFPFTTQGVRVMLAFALGAAGLILLAMASQAALSVSAATKFFATSALALGIAVIAATVFVDSTATKFRAGLFPFALFVAVVVFAWGVLSGRFTERRRSEARSDRLGSRMLAAGTLSVLVGLAVRMLFITEAELLAEVPPAKTSIRLFWFVSFTAVMMWVLARTRFGSWTFAVGGNKEAARQVGVPAARTKTQLFMLVAGAAWLVGMLLAFRINSRSRPTQAMAGVRLHHRCRRRRNGAHRWVRNSVRWGHRRLHHVDAADRHLERPMELRLALPVHRRDPAPRRRVEPVSPHQGRVGSAMSSRATSNPWRNPMSEPALLQLDNISKYYGNIIALSGVSTSVTAGEVTCVLGDNGAGKSTFIKILAGVHQPTEGAIRMNGSDVRSTRHEMRSIDGIATVYQDLAMVPLMSVWRNFFLGSEPTKGIGPSSGSTRRRPRGSRRRDGRRWASTSATPSSRSARCRVASASRSRSPAPATSAPRC